VIRRTGWITGLALLALLLFPVLALAYAPAPAQPSHLVLPGDQVWTLIIGILVPAVTYLLNYVGPWLKEPAKAAVLVVVSAIAGGLYTALATSSFGWNGRTLQLVLTSVIAAFAAHHWFWVPSGIAFHLKAGQNRQDRPREVASTA
jgi:hypothetical protein